MDGLNDCTRSPGDPSLPISVTACERQAHEAQRMFHRTISGWASDLLLLEKRRLRRPMWINAHKSGEGWSMAA